MQQTLNLDNRATETGLFVSQKYLTYLPNCHEFFSSSPVNSYLPSLHPCSKSERWALYTDFIRRCGCSKLDRNFPALTPAVDGPMMGRPRGFCCTKLETASVGVKRGDCRRWVTQKGPVSTYAICGCRTESRDPRSFRFCISWKSGMRAIFLVVVLDSAFRMEATAKTSYNSGAIQRLQPLFTALKTAPVVIWSLIRRLPKCQSGCGGP